MIKSNKNDLSSLVQLAEALAEAGGSVLKTFWGKTYHSRDKEQVGNIVTEADEASEKQIFSLLKKECPQHQILSEESGALNKGSSDYLWIIDPLDGTVNYSHQYPIVSVSVALAHKGKVVIGIVYNPILNEWFQAVRGQGAYFNEQPLSVSKVDCIEKSLLATGFAYDRRETKDNNYAEFSHLTNESQGVRRGGSAALDLAYVAAGKFDGYWERGIQPWDVAAGSLLVEEAGGKVSGYDGSRLDLNSGRILASNALLHEKLITELKKVKECYER